MDHPLESTSAESEETLFADVIRPLARYYWAVLAFAIAGALGLLGLSYSTPVTYATDSIMALDGSYASQEMVVDLLKDQDVKVSLLSGGLIKLTLRSGTPENAVSHLKRVMEVTEARLMGFLPDYESQIALAKEQYLETASLLDRAKTIEERIIFGNVLVENLGEMNNLIRQDHNKENALRVVKEPGSPVASERPDVVNRLGLGGAFGLMIGSLAAFILYNREAMFKLKKAD